MSRIETTFAQLAAQHKKALITYITAGDPAPELVVPLLHAMADAGVNVLELGVPFSDPMAEGPVIQRACERALTYHVNMHDVLGYVKEFRKTNTTTPVVLMGYANPVERFGIDAFIKAAKEAGVDGTIIVDYPPEECIEFTQKMREADMDPIFLLAPTSTEARIRQVSEVSSGFTYYVSLKGVTGAANIDVEDVASHVADIKKYIQLPVAVGFGIRDGETAKAVAAVADGVVIGSRIIAEMEKVPKAQAVSTVQRFVQEIRLALDE